MGAKRHPEEFKKQVVKEALETGNSNLVGRKYNISPSIVARWVRAVKPDPMKKMTRKALHASKPPYQSQGIVPRRYLQFL